MQQLKRHCFTKSKCFLSIAFNFFFYIFLLKEVKDVRISKLKKFISLHTMTTLLINILAFATLLSSIFSITSKNPVISVLFLIGTFVLSAGYLILIGINFIGISYLLVYVGAVSILFLFILMLINVRISELLSNTNKSIPLAIFIIISFIYTFYLMIPDNYISLLDKLSSFAVL